MWTSPDLRIYEEINPLNTSINSVFISPSKVQNYNPKRMIKIKEKILNALNESVNENDISSFSNTYRSSTIPWEMQVTVNSAYSSDISNKENKFPEYVECNWWDKWELIIKNSTNGEELTHRCIENSISSQSQLQVIFNDKDVLKEKDTNDSNLSQHYSKFIEDSQQNKNLKTNFQNSPPESKNMINLENIMLIEKKILEIIDGINKMEGISVLCEDWWELSHEETMLQNLGNVFKEPKYKSILKTASLVEVVSISLCYWVSQHLKTPPKSVLISKSL